MTEYPPFDELPTPVRESVRAWRQEEWEPADMVTGRWSDGVFSLCCERPAHRGSRSVD